MIRETIQKISSRFEDTKKMMKMQDAVFVIMMLSLTVYYIFMIQRGLGLSDESFYFTIPHRMMKGDGLIVDEWNVAQFSAFLQYIPFRIFYWLNGSADGVILYFRCLYLIVKFITTLLLYLQTRKEGLMSLFAAFLFYNHLESGMVTLNYYSFAMFFLLWTSMLLFCGKSAKWKFFAAGLTVSGMVLAEPLTAFIYFLYSFIVLFRCFKKKEDELSYLFNVKSWAYMTSVIAVCAATVLGYVFIKNGFSEVISAVPNFFTDSEYVFPLISEGEQNLFDLELSDFFELFGFYYIFLFIILVDRKRLEHRKIYLAIALILIIVIYAVNVHTVVESFIYAAYRQLAMMFLGITVYLLLKNKDKRWLCFWLTSFFFSIAVNISSDHKYAYMIAAICSNIAGAFLLGDMLREIREENEVKKFSDIKTYKRIVRNRKMRIFCSVMLIVFVSMQLVFECCILPIKWEYLPQEGFIYDTHGEELSKKCEIGPMKGLYTTPKLHRIYTLTLEDMEKIRLQTDGDVFVYCFMPWTYLYFDREYTAYSTVFIEEDFVSRQLKYFELHPDKFPEYIYVPKYDYNYYEKEDVEGQMELLQSHYSCEYEETEMGYIVKVSR